MGAAAGWADPRQVRTAVAGLRRLGGNAPLATGDLMAIGSNTKAMTACAAASVVDQGLLRWDSTLAQTLPELAQSALPAYQQITLRDLLDHRAGVMGFSAIEDVDLFVNAVGPEVLARWQQPAEAEAFFLQWLLRQPPVRGTGADPGFAYSNAGYALAARMLRAATGLGWADLLRQRVASARSARTPGLARRPLCPGRRRQSRPPRRHPPAAPATAPRAPRPGRSRA